MCRLLSPLLSFPIEVPSNFDTTIVTLISLSMIFKNVRNVVSLCTHGKIYTKALQ